MADLKWKSVSRALQSLYPFGKVGATVYHAAEFDEQKFNSVRSGTMKAGILYDDRDIRMGDAPDPRIKSDEVLVESGFAGICGTDLHIYRGEFHERVKFPAIQGHEFGGVIREIGKEVKGFKVGDRVVVDPIISCHSCPACLSGHINACRTLKLLGVDLDGGFGQYVAAPVSRLYRLPDNVPMAHAPMVELRSTRLTAKTPRRSRSCWMCRLSRVRRYGEMEKAARAVARRPF
jgi:hypothetical protein